MKKKNIIIFLIIILIIILVFSIYSFNNVENYSYNQHEHDNKLYCRLRKVPEGTKYDVGKPVPKSKLISIMKTDLKEFIDKDLDNLNRSVIIHVFDDAFSSSDQSVKNYKNFINHKNVIHTYSEDWYDKLTNKITIVPIGLESNIMNTDDENHLLNYSKKQKKLKDKPLKILCNAHIHIHNNPISGSYNQRREMLDELRDNSLIDFWDGKKSKKDCYESHDNYSFELCPEGNGLDTHRFYEAVLFNTIPIVKRNSLEPLYKKFPCVIIDDWNEINETNCKKWKKKYIKNFEKYKKKLYCKYWRIKY